MTRKALGQAWVLVFGTGLFVYVLGYAARLP